MKKVLALFLTAFWVCTAVAAPIQERQIEPRALAELLAAFDIKNDENMIAATQKQWLRPKGKERWEVLELSSEKRAFVLDWAHKQGMFEAWKPAHKSYDKAFILGATTPRMEKRLNYLKKLWVEEGVRFQEIVWLTGDRPLDARVDSFTDRCQNETEAAHLLWQLAELPQEMRETAVSFIAVPMLEENGKPVRPNTSDTIVAWLNTSPEPCSCLFVSDQPFCGYQFAVIKADLPDEFAFDLVGEGQEDPTRHPAAAAITLDCVARWIFAAGHL